MKTMNADAPTSGPWTSEEEELLNTLIDRGATRQGIIAELASRAGRSPQSTTRKLIKIGFLNRHGRPWNRAWGHVR